MSMSGSKIREQVAHFLVDIHMEGLSQAYSNGFTEGMNNKIKVLKRVAFGFRNFERFRSRILLLSMVKLK